MLAEWFLLWPSHSRQKSLFGEIQHEQAHYAARMYIRNGLSGTGSLETDGNVEIVTHLFGIELQYVVYHSKWLPHSSLRALLWLRVDRKRSEE